VAKPQEHPLLTAIAKAQYDLTSAQAWLAEVRRQVAALELGEQVGHRCECGVVFRSARRLVEHAYTSHGGTEPEHWIASEALAEEIDDDSEEVAA
jgi:hypothetical protein